MLKKILLAATLALSFVASFGMAAASVNVSVDPPPDCRIFHCDDK
jgi:hypothetical protein